MQLLPHVLNLLALVMYDLVCRHTDSSGRAACAANPLHEIQKSSELMIRLQLITPWLFQHLEGPWFFLVPW